MRRVCIAMAITAMLGVTLPVTADVLTFDDLGGTILPIPSSYQGFTWSSEFYYLNAVDYYGNPSGYLAGMVSPANVAFNASANDVSVSKTSPFLFNGAYFTSAWTTGLELSIGGWLDGSQVHSTIVTLGDTAPTWVGLDWTVDTLTFHSGGNVSQFAMDNFTTNNVVPLPAGVILGALGLSVAGWRLKRKTA